MFIYSINDQGKFFRFKGKMYKTPCKISVSLIKEIEILNRILKEKSISKIKVENKNRQQHDRRIKQSSLGSENTVTLSTTLKGRQGF